jgi:pyridoxine/pyridoxamine 5'-phosphate oxidase
MTKTSIGLSKLDKKHALALDATPLQNTTRDIELMYIFLNKPEMFGLWKYGENITGKSTLDDEGVEDSALLDEAELRTGLLIPSEIRKRRFTANRIRLSLPLPSELYDYIDVNMKEIKSGKNKGKRKYDHTKLVSTMMLLSISEIVPIGRYSDGRIWRPSCPKEDAVDAIIAHVPQNEKIVIFSQFLSVLSCYQKHLERNGIHSIILTGQHRGGGEKHKLELFKKTDTFRVLLTTTFKSAEGLNLDAANHVIMLEFWWNPQRLIQAMGRIDRVTQKKDIFIYLLCYNARDDISAPEKEYYKPMMEKLRLAKGFNPFQQDFPKVQAFVNEATYKAELDEFLTKYTKPVITRISWAELQKQEQQKQEQQEEAGTFSINGRRIETTQSKEKPLFERRQTEPTELSDEDRQAMVEAKIQSMFGEMFATSQPDFSGLDLTGTDT